MEFVIGTISLSCELFSLSKARADLKRMHPNADALVPAPLGAPRHGGQTRLFIFAR